MRVLHVIGSVDRRAGGPIEGISQMASLRGSSGGDTHIVCLDSPDDSWVAEFPVKTFAMGIRSTAYAKLRRYMPWLRYGYTPHLVPWLRRHVAEYDIVVINGLWNYSAFGAWRALRGTSTPYVVFTHGMLDPWFRRTYPLKHAFKQLLWWFSEGPLLAHARATLFTSLEERVLSRGAFWPYRCREKVIGYGTADPGGDPGLQINAFRTAFPEIGKRPFLLFLSRIHRKKGCDLLIDAFAKSALRQSGMDLVIAGPDQEGWKEMLTERARSLGMGDRVHWPGMLAGDVKWGAFRACDAFVLPSHQENFGIVVAEALAVGKPVLITNKVNIWREVNEEKAGLVADDSGPGIESLLDRYFALTSEQKELMGKNARKCFLLHFEIRQTFATIDRALREAIANEAT